MGPLEQGRQQRNGVATKSIGLGLVFVQSRRATARPGPVPAVAHRPAAVAGRSARLRSPTVLTQPGAARGVMQAPRRRRPTGRLKAI
jgi:hypothetical protein